MKKSDPTHASSRPTGFAEGGVGGFFAREAFEVLVEPPDGATIDETPPTARRRRCNRRRPVIVRPRSPRTTSRGFAEAGAAHPSRRPASCGEIVPKSLSAAKASGNTDAAISARHATILELADAVSEYERNDVIDLIEERNVSTQSRDFAQVLDRFSKSIDAAPMRLPAPTRRDRHSARAPEIDIREPAPPAEPTRRAATATRPSTTDTRRRVDRNRAAPSAFTPVRRARPAPFEDRHRGRRGHRPVRDAPVTVGLPARLIPRGVAQPALKGALVESLTRLPPAPGFSNALGTVIAIVGAGSAPVLLARELACDYSLDPDDVVLATREQLGFGIPAWLQMTDAATAQERRRSWRRRTRPTIVACSLPRDGLAWARDMLDELEPTITWAIIDAGAKREDIVHRIDALGGVDVLALDHLDDTVSPATALELGIPVGRLELEQASPLTWTELLLERMQ